MGGTTLYEKLWQKHVVAQFDSGESLLYIDRHLIHEVTSPQAFEGLRLAGLEPWRPGAALATPDHGISTRSNGSYANDFSRIQVETLSHNCSRHAIRIFPAGHAHQGIVHVIGPEQGFVLPGMTVVCGDSHTSTNGALGCLAFGVGTSEVEHVLATQCLRQAKVKTMRITVTGKFGPNIEAKDLILAIIGQIGTAGGTGHAIEYAGETITGLSMEERMTICNMSIETGARIGFVAVDDTTIAYVRGLNMAPTGATFDRAEAYWRTLRSDPNASFDQEITLDAATLKPQVSWGTNPEMVAPVTGTVPDPESFANPAQRESISRALAYMDLQAGTPITDIRPSKIFIGSCSNARLSDLRRAAALLRGRTIASSIEQAIVVPGSGLVRQAAEEEGLDQKFINAGFEWRLPGCSMCLGMNDDLIGPGERCASTSNRNFEGRQGYRARTHLVSPSMAVAAAIHGHFVDVSLAS